MSSIQRQSVGNDSGAGSTPSPRRQMNRRRGGWRLLDGWRLKGLPLGCVLGGLFAGHFGNLPNAGARFALAQSAATPQNSLQVTEGRATTRNPVVVELPPPILTSQTQFEIPFRTDDLNGRLVEVQLYVSTDLGENWNLYARQSPLTPRIPFASVGDGEYLFALKTLDRDGRLLPTGPPIPTLRIIVDTVRPEMLVQVEPDKMGRLAITWKVTDQNLDKSSLSLSFRAEGPSQPTDWYPLPTGSPATEDQSAEPRWYQDRVTWLPDTTADAIVLKAEIKDQAGNITTRYQPVSLGSLVNRRPAPLLQGAQAGNLAPPDPRRAGPAASPSSPQDTSNSQINPAGENGLASSITRQTPQSAQVAQSAPSSAPPSAAPAVPQSGSPSVPPIDWPASGGFDRGQATGRLASSGPPQANTTAGRASSGTPVGGGESAGTQPDVGALPVQWRRGGSSQTADFGSDLASGRNSDPFQRLLSPEPLGRPEDTAGQNLAIAVGSTLKPPGPLPGLMPAPTSGTLADNLSNLGGTNRLGASGPPPTNLLGAGVAPPPSGLPVESASTPVPSPPIPDVPLDPNAFRVNRLQFRLRYQVDGLLPEQIGSVTIFGSRDDGATWELWTTDADKQSPAEIAVSAAGRYAFRVVVTSVTGNSSHIPRPGDKPEVAVDVDLDPPSPRIVAVPYGRDSRLASLQIQWTCAAADLGPEPIALAYSDRPSGPWTAITDATANTGQFDWALQPNLPQQVYLRIVATDLAGNRGGHVLEQPIDIGPLLPRGRILGIDR